MLRYERQAVVAEHATFTSCRRRPRSWRTQLGVDFHDVMVADRAFIRRRRLPRTCQDVRVGQCGPVSQPAYTCPPPPRYHSMSRQRHGQEV